MTTQLSDGGVNALFFGLTDDLARELLKPLAPFCSNVRSSASLDPCRNADVIFCTADRDMVTRLRSVNPAASIVVVSRFPEVSDWLDSIEAGATDLATWQSAAEFMQRIGLVENVPPAEELFTNDYLP